MITAWLTRIGSTAALIGAAILAFMGMEAARRYQRDKRKEAENRAEVAEAQGDHVVKVTRDLHELKQAQAEREADIVEERKETGRRELGKRWSD